MPSPTELCMVLPYRLAAAIPVDATTIVAFGWPQASQSARMAEMIRDFPVRPAPVIIIGEVLKRP